MDRFDDNAVLVGMMPEAAAVGATRAEPQSEPPRALAEEVLALVYAQVHKLAAERDVEEIAQAAAEQAIRSLPRFEGRAQLSTWTFRVSYLTICKHDRWYRRWLRRFTLTVDGVLPERADEEANGEERLLQRERVGRLRRALERLSAKRRAVLILHDLEGVPVDGIAAVVGITTVAVRSRLRDARNALAEILTSDPYFGDAACRRKEER